METQWTLLMETQRTLSMETQKDQMLHIWQVPTINTLMLFQLDLIMDSMWNLLIELDLINLQLHMMIKHLVSNQTFQMVTTMDQTTVMIKALSINVNTEDSINRISEGPNVACMVGFNNRYTYGISVCLVLSLVFGSDHRLNVESTDGT